MPALCRAKSGAGSGVFVFAMQALVSLLVFFALATVGSSASLASTIEHRVAFDVEEVLVVLQSDGTRYEIDGTRTIFETGAPALVFESRQFVLPHATRLSGVQLLDAKWQVVDRPERIANVGRHVNADGESVAGQHLVDELAFDAKAVTYPRRAVLESGTQIMHGYNIGAVQVFPLRVRDGAVELLTSGRILLDVEQTGEDVLRRTVDWPGYRAREMAEVQALVANPSDVAGFAPPAGIDPSQAPARPKTVSLPEGRVEYVIVTVPSLVSAFQPLADARTREGLPSAIVTDQWIMDNYRRGGDVQESIRFFLQAAYAEWGLRFVLLGGDDNVLPARYAESFFYPGGGVGTNIPADLYFGALDGNWNADADGVYGEAFRSFLDPGDGADMLAEVFAGRAPVQDVAQTNIFVNKVLEYTTPSSTAYLGRALFLSEVLFPADWDGFEPIVLDGATLSEDIIFNSIIGGGNLMQSWRLYENDAAYVGALPETKAAALDSMETGNFGLVHHVGHGFFYNMSVGDANLFAGDAETLTNDPNYFVVYALNCSSGAFDFDCLLERFIQNPNGGSVASMGAARAAFATTADDYQQRFYAEVFVAGRQRIGDAVNSSRVPFSGSTLTDTPDRWTHLTYTLLGDPTLSMWREEPRTAGVTHAASVALDDGSFAVNVTDGGSAASGVLVALTRTDGGFASGLTDVNGDITLSLNSLVHTTGNMTLNVSQGNLMPYTVNIPVNAASGAKVLATLSSVDDSSALPANGDGDGTADSGETVRLLFDFLNNGSGVMATNVSATLSAVSAPGATIDDASITVIDLPGGANSVPSDAFVVTLDPTIGDGTFLDFQVDVTSDQGSWSQDFELLVLAPEIEVARVQYDDSVTGDNNGVITNGENIQLRVELKNYGAGDAAPISGVLSSSSGNVTIVDGSNTWNSLALLESGEGVGTFETIESDASVENFMTLTLTDDWGHVWTHQFELRPPAAPLALLLDTSLSPDSIALRMSSAFQFHFLGFRAYRADDPGGPFTEITIDKLDGSGFYHDTGLASLTKYYYQATVVDSSCVESVPTPVASASTSPPELAGGFPIPLNRELAGPSAVGDLRGDGSNVVTFGADYIMAIDSNGDELVDGDNFSQTLGPLAGPANEPDRRYTPSGVALADLDGDMADDVVAGNWNTFEIWAVKGDGSDVPGWPRTMNFQNWATPSIGDLDNDGDFEIVVNNAGGRTYVWHHDGTDFFDGDANPGSIGVFHVRTGENFGRSTPLLLDVDGDGTLEIIFATHFRNGADNFVYALKNDATAPPGWPKNLGPGGYGVTGLVAADLNNDSVMEIIYPCDNDNLYIWEPDGSDYGTFPQVFTSQGADLDSITPGAAVADFDGDSDLELVVVSVTSDSNCYVHLKDDDGVTRTGGANIWPRQLPGRSETSPVIGDIDGDGSLDILVGIGGGSDTLPNQLFAFDVNGEDVAGFPITLSGSIKSTPVITDFDQDGDTDIVYAGFDRNLHIWDMPFSYSATNNPWPTFHANNQRTGVFSYDPLTAVTGAGFQLRPVRGGVQITSTLEGALPENLRMNLERRVGEQTVYTRLADDLEAVDGRIEYTDRAVESGETYQYRLINDRMALQFFSQTITVPVVAARLHANRPNPFNPSTTIPFEVPGSAGALVPTTLEIYDLSGRRVRVLVAGPLAPGRHELTWDGRDTQGGTVSSGVYFAKLKVAGESRTVKMTLVK